MKNTTEIEWLGTQQMFVPNYGITYKGRLLTLPTDMATSYIKQGLARLPAKKKEAK